MKVRSQILSAVFLASDLLLTAVCWVAAYYLRFLSGWVPVIKDVPDYHLCWANLPLVVLLSGVAYHLSSQYDIHRLRRFREEVVTVVKGTALLLLLVMASTFLSHHPYESRAVMLVFFCLTTTAILIARRSAWAVVRYLRSQGYNQSNCLIVGTGRIARKTARAIRHANWMGFHNVGFVDDPSGRLGGDLPLMGSIADLPRVVEEQKVYHVFIALPLRRLADARRIYNILSRSLVEVRLIVDVPTLSGLSLTTSNLDGLPVVGLRESPHFGLNMFVKRVMDIILALAALVVLGPLMLLIALLVKLTSPGPVFYRQERCGLNGRPFQMLKFRSMRVDAEAQTGAVWAVKDDPRRTVFGTFLRKTSLDELPQFINVLLGDMSLVGPRPERPVFIQQFTKSIPNYMARHSVKAGITGWAQVHGWRGNTSLRKRVQHDLYYITHWTPWLDIRILWMTIWRGLFHRNAY